MSENSFFPDNRMDDFPCILHKHQRKTSDLEMVTAEEVRGHRNTRLTSHRYFLAQSLILNIIHLS